MSIPDKLSAASVSSLKAAPSQPKAPKSPGAQAAGSSDDKKSGDDSFVSKSDQEAMSYSMPGAKDLKKASAKAVKDPSIGVGGGTNAANKPFMPLDSAKMFAGIGDAAKAAGQGMEALMKAIQGMKNGGKEQGGTGMDALAQNSQIGMQAPPPPPPPPPPVAFG